MGIFRRFRPVLAFTALVAVTACTTWEPYVVRSNAEMPGRLRLHLQSGQTVVLRSPSLEGDTAWVSLDRDGGWKRVPLRLVEAVEEGHISGARSVLLVVGVVAGAVVALVGACVVTDCLDT